MHGFFPTIGGWKQMKTSNKGNGDNKLNQEIRAHRHKMAARLAAMDTRGNPQARYMDRLRERVMATVARHFGGSAR